MSRSDNPFERYDIDPTLGPEAITARLRELAAEAEGEQRDELRAVWEKLTMHPRDRLRIALAAFPETREPLAEPPRARLDRQDASTLAPPLGLRDVVLLPSVAASLSPQPRQLPPVLPPLCEDPNLDHTT